LRTIFAETSSGRWTNIADLGLEQNELWKEIDGCRLRYRRGPVRVVCDDPYWALLATYVLGDGDLARNSQVRFYDNEKATLNTIRDMFSEKYGYSFPSPVYEENQYGRGQWVIRTRHAAIHFVLTEYFNVPIGRKKLPSTISERVASSPNPEVKFAALAGMFSSDGYVNCNRTGGRFSVSVCLLTAVSGVKAQRASKMLHQVGFHPFVSVTHFHNPLSHRETTAYAVVVNRHAEVVKLFFRLFPYLVKPSRTKRWMELIGDGDFYRRIKLRSPSAQLFLRKAAMKIAGNSYRYLHVLVTLAREQGIEISRWGGVKHWTSDRGCSIPLAILVECCRILGEDVFDYVPVEFGVLLWLHQMMSYRRLVAQRHIEPLLPLDDMLPTNDNPLQKLGSEIALVSR
jgi:hypothetical protein